MNRREFTVRLSAVRALAPLPLLSLPMPAVRAAVDIRQDDAVAAVRAALERGADAAIRQLGVSGGFLANPRVRIPLPPAMESAAKVMRVTGQRKRVDELVTSLNRAAESAVPAAKPLLLNAVKSMKVEDAQRILGGGDTSVTEFFSRKTREPLATKFLPIVTRATDKLALADRYNTVAAKASSLGLLRDDEANVQRYVTGKTIDGLFLMIGEEERKIRRDPVGTGSALLRRAFGR